MLKYITLFFVMALAACSFDVPQDVRCGADEVRPERTCIDGIWVIDDLATTDAGADSTSADGGVDQGSDPDMGCIPESDTTFCERLSATCDTLFADDNCGAARTADCGPCAAPLECGAGGTANVCACPGSSDDAVCASLNKNCGSLETEDPTCGVTRTFNCGTCDSPLTCGGSGVDNVCGCFESNADFCARLNTCGTTRANDACGIERQVDCGGCQGAETCGGGGAGENMCGCDVATACDALGYECGTEDLGPTCSNLGTEDCGSCGAGNCVNHLCECPVGYAFDGVTCADIDECGTNTDNCDANATCANSQGSFSCVCNAGYTGNGVTCTSSGPSVAEVVSATSGSGDTLTTPNLVGSNTDVYFVFVSIRTSARQVDGVQGLGLSWSRLDSECDGNGSQRLEVWGARGNATTGGVTVDLNDDPYAFVVTAIRVTGVAASGSTGNRVTDNASVTNSCVGSIPSTSYSYDYTPTNGSLIITGVATSGRDHTPGAGFTEISDERKTGYQNRSAGLALTTRMGAGTEVQINGTFNAITHWAGISFEVVGP